VKVFSEIFRIEITKQLTMRWRLHPFGLKTIFSKLDFCRASWSRECAQPFAGEGGGGGKGSISFEFCHLKKESRSKHVRMSRFKIN